MSMRILHLTLSFAKGGRRQAITTLLERFRLEGPECDLGCLDELGCAPEEIGGLVGDVAILDRRMRHAATDLKALERLLEFCNRRRIDIIHAHDAASHLFGAFVRLKQPQIRLLMTFHRTRNFESATVRSRFRNALAIALSDFIVCGSRERREHFVRTNYVRAEKVLQIPFGVDTDRFQPNETVRESLRNQLGLEPETLVLGAVGHFGPEKGIDVVLRGFGSLAHHTLGRPVALVVVGDGTADQRDQMRALASGDMPGPVIFANYQRDVERWFQAFDVLLHAPRQEAFGLVLAEAMASGLPIVASRVGGIPDIVRPEETGLLVPPDSADPIAKAVLRLASDADLCQAMGNAGRQVALTRYSAERYAGDYLQTYGRMLERRPCRSAALAPSQLRESTLASHP